MTIGEWDHRQLCPDGGCIGLIGNGGTCKTCGRAAPNWGEPRKRGMVADVAEDEGEGDDEDADEGDDEGDDEDHDEDGNHDAIGTSAPAVFGHDADWNERTLCPDGACVGVIGSGGTCGACGKAARSLPSRASERTEAPRTEPPETELDAAAADLARTMEPEDANIAPALDAADSPTQAAASQDLEPERTLCPDGACVGVIGSAGTCKLCGKAAA